MYRLGGTLRHDTLRHDTLGHDDDISKPAARNQFGERRIDAKCTGHDCEIWTTSEGANDPDWKQEIYQATQRRRRADEDFRDHKTDCRRYAASLTRCCSQVLRFARTCTRIPSGSLPFSNSTTPSRTMTSNSWGAFSVALAGEGPIRPRSGQVRATRPRP